MQHRQRPILEVEELYRLAVRYGRVGDVYNAVKLCKLIARKSPDWSAPYALLSSIYKGRNEWKPALYYSLRALENNPFDEVIWENMALSATAMADWYTARQAWNQLGFKFRPSYEEPCINLGPIAARLNPSTQPEIVEAHRIDPARAIIKSIPQPSSGKRYLDEILISCRSVHNLVSRGRHFEVYDELEVLRTSSWQTFAVILQTPDLSDVEKLANLCRESEIGFDNWSNAARFLQSNLHEKVWEYYDHTIFGPLKQDAFLVALAAQSEKEVRYVLKNWEIISLKQYQGLDRLY